VRQRARSGHHLQRPPRPRLSRPRSALGRPGRRSCRPGQRHSARRRPPSSPASTRPPPIGSGRNWVQSETGAGLNPSPLSCARSFTTRGHEKPAVGVRRWQGGFLTRGAPRAGVSGPPSCASTQEEQNDQNRNGHAQQPHHRPADLAGFTSPTGLNSHGYPFSIGFLDKPVSARLGRRKGPRFRCGNRLLSNLLPFRRANNLVVVSGCSLRSRVTGLDGE
jgi:hypothetical protein